MTDEEFDEFTVKIRIPKGSLRWPEPGGMVGPTGDRILEMVRGHFSHLPGVLIEEPGQRIELSTPSSENPARVQ